MKIKNLLLVIGCWFLGLGLAGCTVRTYSLTKDRVDQDLMGNRGYIQGAASASEMGERKPQRTVQVVEIELGVSGKLGKAKGAVLGKQVIVPREVSLPETKVTERESLPSVALPVRMKEYKVQKGDTLQKISQAFYGTTKKWNKIYDANRDKLRGPDKIYPGQIINIPLEELKEPKENLK